MLASSSSAVCRSLLLRRSGALSPRGTNARMMIAAASNRRPSSLTGSSSWRTPSTEKSGGGDAKAAAATKAEPEEPMSIAEEPSEPAIIDETVRMRNNGMAVVLVGVCVGIAYYSMNAVGQGGATTDKEDDPLAALKQEAAIAARDQQRKEQDAANSMEMVEQFQKGAYDPDDSVSEEGGEGAPKKNKPWWKFWSRS